MRRIVIASMLLLLVMSVSSFATQTRTMTMGMNNMIMVDDNNIGLFPGRTYNYPNLAVAEIGYLPCIGYSEDYSTCGQDEFHNLGILWQFNEDNPWVLGTFISTLPAVEPDFSYYSEGYISSNRRIDLYYGRQFGTKNFGLNLNLIHSSAKEDYSETYTDPDTTWTETEAQDMAFHYYGFSFGLTEAGGQWDVALDAGFGGWTDKDNDGEMYTEPDGYTDFGIRGRYFKVISPKLTWVPHVAVNISKRGAKIYQDGDSPFIDYNNPDSVEWYELDYSIKENTLEFDLGVGLNYTSGPNLLAVMDVGIRYMKYKGELTAADTLIEYWKDEADYEWELYGDVDEYSWKNFVLPYLKIGVEGEVFSWMDVRFGATTYWNNETQEWTFQVPTTTEEPWEWDVVDKWTYKDAHNETYLGFGFHFGRLHVDTYTDPHLFLRGFDFISGSEDYYYGKANGGNDMNWQLTALYEMF